jgi:hypothetical protein
MTPTQRIKKAMVLIECYGQIDGSHHKAWVLDQVARVLMADKYDEWATMMLGDLFDDGYEYEYDTGVAP